jgi:hypothetical protein
MRVRVVFLAGILCVTGSSSCNSVPEATPHLEVTDSSGIRIVQSRSPQWEPGGGWEVPSDPSLIIGSLTGPEEMQLMSVSDAARRSDGAVVVVDRGAQTVRLYDEQGDYLLTFGGRGSGPGEFQDPNSVLITSGDSAVVWDSQLFRFTQFDQGGVLASVETLDLGIMTEVVDPPLYPGSIDLLADGDLLIRLSEKEGVVVKNGAKGSTTIVQAPRGFTRSRSGALRVAGDLSSVDTLMLFADTAKVTVDAPWGLFPLAPPLADGTDMAYEGEPPRICMGDRVSPQVHCFDSDGGRTLIRWDPRSGSVKSEEVSEWREQNLRLLGMKLREEDILSVLDQVPVPSERPQFSALTLDVRGNLWVRLGPTEGSQSPSVDYLVFDSGGSLLGEMVLPQVQVLEIGEDYVMGLHRDEFEVEYVHIYELRKPLGLVDGP